MTIQIELSSQAEERLRDEATRRGQDATAYARQVLERQLLLAALRARKPPKSVSELRPREPAAEGTNWLSEISGQWPGAEPNEEILAALKGLS